MTQQEHGSVAMGDSTLQSRVQPWMMACFGPEISADRLERNDRFIEEALELVQASDYPKERALALVDYVYGRDQGEINQEVGGVMITLAAHCLAHGVDMHEAGETELARIWTKVDAIRAKQAAKPTGSALPVSAPQPAHGTSATERVTSDQPVLFGLEAQGHIPTVEAALSEGTDWQQIGRRIGWDGETARQYYERHLARSALATPTPNEVPSNQHEFVPDQKYPWFCAHCGYVPHEPLMHFSTPTPKEECK